MSSTAQPTLAETERLVWKLITAPEGVEKALVADSTVVLPVRGDHRLSAVERLDIYANMYFYRIRDSLKQDFPALLAMMGEGHFHNLVTDYLLAYPSEHWSLRNVGVRLPQFLENHSTRERWPFLSELARFEWALIDAFDAADASPLTLDRLKEFPPEEWASLSFSVIPSFAMESFTWKVDDLHQLLTSEAPFSDPKPSPLTLIFWRQELTVKYRPVEAWEQALLKGVCGGRNFAELCEIAAERVGVENAVQSVSAALMSWLESGFLK